MADRGIDQVSMREIAEKVKVTKPVLYYYFKNKEDLCRSIVAEHEQGFSKLLEDSFNRGDELESVLNRLLGAHLEFFRKTPVNSKFVVQNLLSNTSYFFSLHIGINSLINTLFFPN